MPGIATRIRVVEDLMHFKLPGTSLDQRQQFVVEVLDKYARLKRSSGTGQPYQRITADGEILQYAAMAELEKWEIDQEADCPIPSDILLARWIQSLVWPAVTWNSHHRIGMALGAFLFDYDPSQISKILPFSDGNIRRIKSQVGRRLAKRWRCFEPKVVVYDQGNPQVVKHSFAHRDPTEKDREVVRHARVKLAPGFPSHPRSEYHRLVCPVCGGIETFIKNYNQRNPNDSLVDPDNKLCIPTFLDGMSEDNSMKNSDSRHDITQPKHQSNSANGYGLTVRSLTSKKLTTIKHTLRHQASRRRLYLPGPLGVYLDGEQLFLEFDPRKDSISKPFGIPEGTSEVEVFGRDEEGDLCLASFLLPDIDGEKWQGLELFTRLEGWQKIKLVISPPCEANGELAVARIQVTYIESPLTFLVRLLAHIGEPARRFVRVAVPAALALAVAVSVYQQREIKRLKGTMNLFEVLPVSMRNETSIRLQELEKDLPKLMRGATSKTFLTLGTIFMYGEQFNKAIEFFERAKQIRPTEGEPYKAIAAIYKIEGVHEKSVQNLEAFLQRRPQDHEAWNFLGWSYYSLGEYETARKAYEQALQILPDYSDALFNLGLVEDQHGNVERSNDLFQKALQLLHREIVTEPEHAAAHFQLAKIYAHEKKWDQAVSYLRMAIAKDPEWAFWVRYEVHFKEIIKARPEIERPITTLADTLVASKVKQMLAAL